jgi:hypothetical protein
MYVLPFFQPYSYLNLMEKDSESLTKIGYMHIYIRRHGRQQFKRFRFPTARYSRQELRKLFIFWLRDICAHDISAQHLKTTLPRALTLTGHTARKCRVTHFFLVIYSYNHVAFLFLALNGPFVSYTPWTPIFMHPPTRQTLIYSKAGWSK